MTRHGSIFARVLAVATLTLVLLSGCSRGASDIQPSTAKNLQTAVVTIAKSASSGNLTGALTQLTALESDLRQATAAGTVTGDRSARIQAAIEIVRSDIQAQLKSLAPTPSPSPPSATPTPKDGHGKGDKGNR